MRSAFAVASPGVDQLHHLLDGEAVREHDRLGRAVAGREQFERAAAAGLGRGER